MIRSRRIRSTIAGLKGMLIEFKLLKNTFVLNLNNSIIVK